MKYRNTARPSSAVAIAAVAAAAGLLAGPAAGAAVYTWNTTDGNGNGLSDNWSTGFAPGPPPSDFGTQLVFVPGTYTATDDLGTFPNPYDLNAITVNNAAGNTLTVGVSPTGPGTPTLGGANSNFTVNGGNVLFGPQLGTSDGTQIVNNGAGTLNLSSGVLFATNGTATITNAGAGTLILGDGAAFNASNAVVNLANTGGGVFEVGNLGTVTGNAAAGINGTINVTAGPVVFAGNTGGDLFTNGVILNVAAGASFDFAGNGEQMGGITGGGTVLLTAASVSFNEAGDRAFNGVFSGTGGVTQNVANVLTLGGQNVYSGTTTVGAGGTIRATAANAFSPNSVVSVAAGGTLDPNGLSQTIAGLTGGAAATVVPVTAGTLTIDPAAGVTDTFAGSVAGAGNLTIAGAGVESLGGAAGVTGAVNVSSGTLREGFPALSAASAVTIGSTGTLDTVLVTNGTAGFALSGTGALVKEGVGTLTLAAASPTANLSAVTVVAGGLTLAASGNGASQVGTPALTAGSGTVSYVAPANAATQTFNGVTLTGSLELNASGGAVAVGGLTRPAGSAGAIDFNPVTAGATFTTTTANGTGGTIGGYATYAGGSWAVAGAGGALAPLPGSAYTANTFGATTHTDVTAATAAAAGAAALDVRFNTAAATTLTLAGTAANPNVLTNGGLLVTPAVGANGSTVTGGVLTAPANTDLVVQQFNPAAGLTVASALAAVTGTATTATGVTTTTSTTITVPSTAGLAVGEFVSGGTLAGGTRVVRVNSPTSVTVTLSPTAGTGQTLTFTPVTQLVKAGPGQLTLSGANAAAFNGSIGLDAGTVSVAAATNLGGSASNAASSAVIFNGGTLSTTASFSVSTLQVQPLIFAPAGGTINVAAGTTFTRDADSIFGSGPLTLTSPGAGILGLGANGSPYTGPVTVNGGILRFTSNQFTNAGGVTVNAGGQYQVNDNSLTGSYNFAAGTPLTLAGAGPAGYADPGAMAVTVQTTLATNNTTFTNPVVLSANATVGVYSTGTGSGTAVAFPDFLTLTGGVSGPGTLTVAGIAATNGAGGVLTLTGAGTYAGGTVVASGTLRVNNTAGSGTGTGGVAVLAGATLGGTGTVGNGTTPVVVQGTITAGANASTGIGTLTTGAQQWNGSGGLLAKVSADGTANDRLILSGLAVAATAASPFNVSVASAGTPTLAAGSVLVLATDAEAAATNPFAPGTNAAATLAALTLTSTGGVTAPAGYSLALGTQADAAAGFDLVLDDVAAPEPTSLLLAAAAVAPLALGRRRRRAGPAA